MFAEISELPIPAITLSRKVKCFTYMFLIVTTLLIRIYLPQDSEDKAERLSVEKRTLEQQLSNMKSNAAELEHILQKSHADKTSLEGRLLELSARVQEQIKLREADSQLQQQFDSQANKVCS